MSESFLTNRCLNSYKKSEIDQLLAKKADKSSLSKVATTGSYNDLIDKPITQSGSFQLTLASSQGAKPVYTTEYNYGKYQRIDNICYIAFKIKANITNAGSYYAMLEGLPYTSAQNLGQALAIQEAYGGLTGNPDLCFGIVENSKTISLRHNGGMSGCSWGDGDLYIGASGFYFISA